MEDLLYDITVRRLDDFLRGIDDPSETVEYVHGILRFQVNFLMTSNPRVRFVVDGLKYGTNRFSITTRTKFHLTTSSVEMSGGVDWYHSKTNVQS